MQPYEPNAQTGIPPGRRRPVVNAGTLWSGGLAAAIVAALIVVVGVVIARGLFDVAVLAPKSEGTFGDASTWGLALGAAVAALLATALIQVLVTFTPRPFAFFGWIVGLITVVGVLIPYTTDASSGAKLATALINLLIGIAIGSLVSGVAARSLTRPIDR